MAGGRAIIRYMTIMEHTQRDHDEAVVVKLTADHLRAIEAALSLAHAVLHEEITVSDPDEIGTAMVAAEGLTSLTSLTTLSLPLLLPPLSLEIRRARIPGPFKHSLRHVLSPASAIRRRTAGSGSCHSGRWQSRG